MTSSLRRRSPPRRRTWRFRLYVAGQTPRSIAALDNLKRLCDADIGNRYEIEVIDLLKHPHRARQDQIVAVPTLVRKLPRPMRKIIGDLSSRERVLVGLGLPPTRSR
jgi:circadian clock protein KaiB